MSNTYNISPPESIFTSIGINYTPAWSTTTGPIRNMPDPITKSVNNKLRINDNDGTEIVRITNEGDVVWGKDINITKAAKALEQAFTIGVEMKAGITEKVKINIRNMIFETLIAAAEDKGSLTIDEIKTLYKGAKVMDVLQGKI